MYNNGIVGFHSHHDCSYCILIDGIPLIHNELERFTREKEPYADGLNFLFQTYTDWDEMKYFAHVAHIFKRGIRGEYSHTFNTMKSAIRNNDGDFFEPGHHQAHAANAFFSSNFEEALIVTIDGGGFEPKEVRYDGKIPDVLNMDPSKPGYGYATTCFTVWEGKDNKIKCVDIVDSHKINVGGLWRETVKNIFGLSTGYPYGNQSGTVMGMACLGKTDKYVDNFYNHDMGSPHHIVSIPAARDWERLKSLADENEQNRFDIAHGLQAATERLVKEELDPYIEKYKPKNLCLVGGVALNSVMIGKMYDWYDGIVENIYIPPVPYDAGLTIGSAQFVWHQVMDKPRIKWKGDFTPFLGKTYDEKTVWFEIDKVSDQVDSAPFDDKGVVELLAGGKVISVFGGGSESGRRALGNRSILADPRRSDMKDIINEKVKHRQWFRPFAPSVLREDVSEWFERDVDSPYMTTVIKFKEEVRDKVPAVVHFDGSARLQTVTYKNNKWYYNFIKKFKEKTGVPMVLNTSFNDREPIVETPEHAINCFLGTDIDCLYFFDYGILLRRRDK